MEHFWDPTTGLAWLILLKKLINKNSKNLNISFVTKKKLGSAIKRNKIKRYPKSSDPTIYSRATGFETLIGWLFLKDPQRLSTLFEYLELKMNWIYEKLLK